VPQDVNTPVGKFIVNAADNREARHVRTFRLGDEQLTVQVLHFKHEARGGCVRKKLTAFISNKPFRDADSSAAVQTPSLGMNYPVSR
jgi:hypothetical protein